MIKYIVGTALLLSISTVAMAKDLTINDQIAKIAQARNYELQNKKDLACKSYAEAEEMGYFGDFENRTDPKHNKEYVVAALKFAECLDNNAKFAKPYKDDGLQSVMVYTNLNEMYHSQYAQALLNKEQAALALEASKLRDMPSKDILKGKENASKACAAAHTGFNSIGFTGRENERKNEKINHNYVSTGISLAFCNLYHPAFAKLSSPYVAINEANTILTSLSTEYGSKEAAVMLKKMQPLLDVVRKQQLQ